MPKAERKKAFVVRPFRDSGTGRRFAAGETPMLEAGAFVNYQAGGLVREYAEEDAAASPRSARKSAATVKAASSPEDTAPSA